jgi:hypothetical protein
MPITAKLSKAFYDQFGEDVVTELVDLLNLVDETYRAELREANARNFQHFEVLLDKRVAEVNARIDGVQSALNARMDRLDLELKAQIPAIVPAVDLRLARDGRRNLAWFLATLIALFGSQIVFAAR